MKGHSYKWKRKGLKHGNLQEYMEMESMSQEKDEHEQDLVMPGFRFHPTEEELIEFYLRRKVEGKRFNVELISLLDLYSYDPWELPAMGAIGEKEWFFYVPRDRKYRNGDRPNRVTTSGYWKATGADRMIRTENLRSIGLKKTLVFYTGKAPKGTRTSWIMNEYRLPHHETSRLQKISSKTHNAPLQAEISLCRVYKRTGVEDHYSSRSSSSATASSNSRRTELDKKSKNRQPSTSSPHLSNAVTTAFPPIERSLSTTSSSINQSSELLSKHRGWGAINEDAILNQNSRQVPPFSFLPFFSSAPTSSTVVVDELNRLVELQQFYIQPNQFQPSHPLLNTLPNSLPPFPDNPWELNPMP